MINGSAYNAALVNGSGWTQADAKTYSPDQPYILQLRDSSGTMLAKIDQFTDGSWQSGVNDSNTLTVTLPLDSAIVQSGDVDYPNRIWLYDSTLELQQQFIIVRQSINHTDGTYTVEAEGLLYLLDQEYIPLTASINVTNFRLFLKNLMDLQLNANPISIGYIHPSIANAAPAWAGDWDKSILTALQSARKAIGGIISIDSYGRLRWDADTGRESEYSLSIYDDIELYTEEIDSDTVINRIYAEGTIYAASTTSHIRRTLPSPGYIEDTASQAQYGIRPQRISLNVRDGDELLNRATKILNYLKEPQKKRDISAIDLARVQLDPDNPATPHPEYIFAGARIKVIPPSNIPNATPFDAIILTVDRSLTDFLGVQITIGDIDPRRTSSSGGSSSEFFDDLDNAFDELDDWKELLLEQDQTIWEALDALQTDFDVIEEPETDVNEIQAVGAANALGTNTKFAPSDHEHEGVILVHDASYTTQSNLGTPAGAALGSIDDGQTDSGVWLFPDDGAANSDWVKILPTIEYDSSWTAKSNLGNPQCFRIGYLPSGAGNDAGFWIYPPDGTTNADWIPLPSYG